MKNKTTLNIIFYISIFALGTAYFIEYILDYKPCNLCLIERLPYFLAIIIILLGLSFTSATILSLYHVGIEQGFFKESLVCVSNNEINILNKKDLLNEFQKTTVSCKDVEFTLFGLSLATINVIISLILSVITFKLFFNYEKNR